MVYNSNFGGCAYKFSGVRAKIPQWITWEMLSKWVAEYDRVRGEEAEQLSAVLAASRAEAKPDVERAALAPDATWEMDRSAGGYAEPPEEDALPRLESKRGEDGAE